MCAKQLGFKVRSGGMGLAAALALLLLATGCTGSSLAATPTASVVLATPAPTASVPVRIQDASEFEHLKGRGQPTLLAVLDETYG